MVVKRGEVWWALTPEPGSDSPGIVRPVVILQTDPFNKSRIPSVIVAIISSDMRLAESPGNVKLSRQQSGLDREAVVDVARICSLQRGQLSEQIGTLSSVKQRQVEEGLRLILGL